MTDENGDTVDTFPPFSTLEEVEQPHRQQIDDGDSSLRVIGKVTGRTQTSSNSLADGEDNMPMIATQSRQRAILSVLKK